MSRVDCISNRNIKIIATYVNSKQDNCESLFEGLTYPAEEYPSPDDFFLNEDEWTTYENFQLIFRRAREMVDEPNFFFNCGASSARLRSLGRVHYFEKVFASPNEGFKRLPFFNKNFVDTKEIEIVLPPAYDRQLKKVRTTLRIEFHSDFDPNKDYIGDPYTRGIFAAIPTIWGLPPASVRQPLKPYDPEILFNEEPEFLPYGLDVRIDEGVLSLRDPVTGRRRPVGEKVLLKPEILNGRKVFLGKHTEHRPRYPLGVEESKEAILIKETIRADNRILLKAGEIFKAPYFIVDITYDQLSFFHRLSQIFRVGETPNDSGTELLETIDQLRKSIGAKNEAYLTLEKTNVELRMAKARLDEYSRELEQKVEKRTAELKKAQQDLLQLNQNLESKVENQISQLERYNELRRYLSPKLTERILTSGHSFGTEPQRKMLTVVFTDIRGFSSLTDSLESEELFHLLDRYLSEMIKIIHNHDGTLNKIVGDGLLIFFGDPIPMEDHAERAVRMAIDMQNQVADLRNEWDQYGHELGVGIGINTGFVTVGNIGSDMHRDYTVIGNQVNVAARLEALAKAGQILMSQRTYSKTKDL
ncbi:MAG: adenylate/guanylate cyclase domain-containing protein, partial [Thermodesulfobacteriota bacterium]|nr:adenylate/guanylate cyclase domain-containing protein [Thermodesulfobacteriota bacterium]